MTAKEFFEQHPVDVALQVGTDFFFQEYAGSARDYAKRMGLEVVPVTRTEAEADGTEAEADGTEAEADGTEAEADGTEAESEKKASGKAKK